LQDLVDDNLKKESVSSRNLTNQSLEHFRETAQNKNNRESINYIPASTRKE
jgi:hypothetical protein